MHETFMASDFWTWLNLHFYGIFFPSKYREMNKDMQQHINISKFLAGIRLIKWFLFWRILDSMSDFILTNFFRFVFGFYTVLILWIFPAKNFFWSDFVGGRDNGKGEGSTTKKQALTNIPCFCSIFQGKLSYNDLTLWVGTTL